MTKAALLTKASFFPEAELPNGDIVLVVGDVPDRANTVYVTDRNGENKRTVRRDHLDPITPNEGISRDLSKQLYAATSPKLIGTVGDFLIDPKLLKQFAAILWVPVWAFPGLAEKQHALGTTFNGGPKHIYIQLDGGADNQIFYHEMVHADRIAKGRPMLKSDRGLNEDSAERGQQYYAEREGKEFEKPIRREATMPKIDSDVEWAKRGLERTRAWLADEAKNGKVSDDQFGRLLSAAFDHLVDVNFKETPVVNEPVNTLRFRVSGSYNAAGNGNEPVLLKLSPGLGAFMGESALNGTSWWEDFVKQATGVLVHEHTHALQFNRWRTEKRKQDPMGKAYEDGLERYWKNYSAPKSEEQSAYGDVTKYLGNQVEITAHARQAVSDLKAAGMEAREIHIWLRRKGGWNILAQKSKAFQSYYRIYTFNPRVGAPIFRKFLTNVIRALAGEDTAPISREDYEMGEAFTPSFFSKTPNNSWTLDRKPRKASLLVRQGKKVFHGTPYVFEDFTTEKIGESEGGSDYGWGLYFTESREVAGFYSGAKGMAGAPVPTFYDIKGVRTTAGSPEQKAADLVFSMGVSGARRLAREMLRDAKRGDEWTNDKGLDYYQGIFDLTQLLAKSDVRRSKGQIVEADIPEETEMLYWDAPLDQQPVKVKEALQVAGVTDPGPGSKIYKRLAEEKGSKKGASLFLHSLGIKGVRYLDGASRSQGSGISNFVVFDPQDVKKMYSVTAAVKVGTITKGTHVYHGTDAAAAEDIRKRGIDLSKCTAGYFGVAFYTALEPELAQANYADFSGDDDGGAVLEFEVVGGHILDLHESEDWNEYASLKVRPDANPNFPRMMVSKGVDGLADESFGGVCFYNPRCLKLIGFHKPAKTAATTEAPVSRPAQATGLDAWFSGSKVVNADGSPKVVYHGTNQDFDEFKDERRGGSTSNTPATLGFWFADHPGVSSEYADMAARHIVQNVEQHEQKTERLLKEIAKAERKQDWDTQERLTSELEDHELNAIHAEPQGANVMPVYLRITNPKVVDVNGSFLGLSYSVADVISEAKSEGHDGVIFKQVDDSPDSHTLCDHYVVFRSNQIKSAIGNSGAFDPKKPSVTASARDKRREDQAQRLGIEEGIASYQSYGDRGEDGEFYWHYVTVPRDEFKESINNEGIGACPQCEDYYALNSSYEVCPKCRGWKYEPNADYNPLGAGSRESYIQQMLSKTASYHATNPATGKPGDATDADEIYGYCNNLHRNPGDFEEGDLGQRINRFPFYVLKSIPLSSLDLDEWELDEDLAQEYADLGTSIPPIVIHPNGSIVDGTHRANAAALRGDTNILAWVGTRKLTASVSEDDSPDSHTLCDHFVVFRSNQIKSAIGNNGEFDPTNTSVVASALKRAGIYTGYHGTNASFEQFEEQKRDAPWSRRLGFYFTSNPRYAKCYGKRVIKAQLTINKPFDVRGLPDIKTISILPVPEAAKRELRSGFRGNDGNQYGLLEAAERFQLRASLEALGYDGIIYEEGCGPSYIVFSNSQIAAEMPSKNAAVDTACKSCGCKWSEHVHVPDFSCKNEPGCGCLGFTEEGWPEQKKAKLLTRTAAAPNLDVMLDELMKVLQPGLPKPEIKIVNTKANWLGQDQWLTGIKDKRVSSTAWCADNTTITLQKAIMADERTLKNTLAHELCHHEDNLVNNAKKFKEVGFSTYQMLSKYRDGHGAAWQAIAARFNAVYGANFVTKTSDERDVFDESVIRPYYLLLHLYSDGVIRGQQCSIIGVSQRKVLATCLGYNQEVGYDKFRLFKVTDPDFRNAAPLKQYEGFTGARDAAGKEKVQKLWDEGENLLPQFTSAYDPNQKPYFVLMGEYLRGKLAWQSAMTLTPKMKEYLARHTVNGGTKLFQTDDPFFLDSRKIAPDTTPRFSRTPEEQEKALKLWNEGVDLLPQYARGHKASLLQLKSTGARMAENTDPPLTAIYRDALGNPEPNATICVSGAKYGRPGPGWGGRLADFYIATTSDAPEHRWPYVSRELSSVEGIVAEMEAAGWKCQVVKAGDGAPMINMVHQPTLAAREEKNLPLREAVEKGRSCYVRFGTIPTSGLSTNFRDNRSEKGVSVFRARRHKGTCAIFVTTNDELGSLVTMDSRPLFEVAGTYVGLGSDGEPLLTNCTTKRIRDKVGFTTAQIAAFYPNQIKSVKGNSGKFDPNTNSIAASTKAALLKRA